MEDAAWYFDLADNLKSWADTLLSWPGPLGWGIILGATMKKSLGWSITGLKWVQKRL